MNIIFDLEFVFTVLFVKVSIVTDFATPGNCSPLTTLSIGFSREDTGVSCHSPPCDHLPYWGWNQVSCISKQICVFCFLFFFLPSEQPGVKHLCAILFYCLSIKASPTYKSNFSCTFSILAFLIGLWWNSPIPVLTRSLWSKLTILWPCLASWDWTTSAQTGGMAIDYRKILNC